MRRLVLFALSAVLFTAACAAPAIRGAAAPSAIPDSGSATPAVPDDDVNLIVLRHYLTGGDNSFAGFAFPVVYVLDHTYLDAASALGSPSRPGAAITPAEQQHIIDALRGTANIQFVASEADVIVSDGGCAHVRDNGIVITLGVPVPVTGSASASAEAHFEISSFFACLGAEGFTYVLHHDAHGWTVTGTTGSAWVA
jgi:hypothetical protein